MLYPGESPLDSNLPLSSNWRCISEYKASQWNMLDPDWEYWFASGCIEDTKGAKGMETLFVCAAYITDWCKRGNVLCRISFVDHLKERGGPDDAFSIFGIGRKID